MNEVATKEAAIDGQATCHAPASGSGDAAGLRRPATGIGRTAPRVPGDARDRVVVVGAGSGGLSAAIALAIEGRPVTVVEAGPGPGGKMRDIDVDGTPVPAGPTVLTMRWAFDELLAPLGLALEDIVAIEPSEVLARHAWTDGSALDLMADEDDSAERIAAFASRRDAEGFRAFCRESRRIHDILLDTHMRAQRPSFAGLMGRIGPRRFPDMMALRPYSSLWKALSQHFRDPRLRQLFGRYATYTGSSPHAIPATLMLIAHVERAGVWRVAGGMAALARALEGVASRLGVELRYGEPIERIEVEGGRATGVRLKGGGRIAAAGIVANADAGAMADLAPEAGVPRVPRAKRSYSALTVCARARTRFPLAHHTVFFSDDYRAEFDELARGEVPDDPTTYICASARDDAGRGVGPDAAEPMLMLVNAPANGDARDYHGEVETCRQRMTSLLRRCGMELEWEAWEATTPTDFAARFPATGGALYGRTTDGPFAGFRRPGATTSVPNLTLAGGSCHPGPGVPMSAISGRLAAERLTAALASTSMSRPAAISGGTATASATTGATPSR